MIPALKGRHFLSTLDLTNEEFLNLIELGLTYKRSDRSAYRHVLGGRGVGLVFFDPSLRTRASMTMAVAELGGVALPLDIGQSTWSLEHQAGVIMNGSKTEHVKEAVAVLSQYVAAIGVRCFPKMQYLKEDRRDEVVAAFREYAKVPIINLESSMWHPCQALADMMTIRETFGAQSKKRLTLVWANHPKALPHAVPNSFAVAAMQCGHDLTIAAPKEYQPDEFALNKLLDVAKQSGSKLMTTTEQAVGYQDAEVIYAKSWASTEFYGSPEKDLDLRKKYQDWIVTEDKMKKTERGVFMHCLPVRRNVVVADEILDGPRSIVVEQAGNRLYMQKALLASILG